jgi:hypothetical protein
MTERWQPISTVPDDSVIPILVFCPGANRGLDSCEVVIVVIMDDGELSFWTNGGPNGGEDLWFEKGREPTLWMPLPDPPSGLSYKRGSVEE